MDNFKDITYIKQQIVLQEEDTDGSVKPLVSSIDDVSDFLVANEYHYNYNIDYLYKEIMADGDSGSTLNDYETIINKYSTYLDAHAGSIPADNIDLNILIISIIDHLKYIKTSIEENNDHLIKEICLEQLYKNLILKIDTFLGNLLVDSISLINLVEYSKELDSDVEEELTRINDDMVALKEKVLDNLGKTEGINVKEYPFLARYLE